MNTSLKIVEIAEKPLSMNPKKFALWLFMCSVMMMFASLTSAYIVRRGDGNWRVFDIPDMFWISSVIVVLSSVTMHMAMVSAKKDNLTLLRTGIISTTLLGLGFLVA
ncbi:MAG: cytochrome oxidase subunit III, partial [Cyclobacteriaceae bacterium]|nr:cytochrome oxidase subunit III [Cyclobacteriaceae bacterium]